MLRQRRGDDAEATPRRSACRLPASCIYSVHYQFSRVPAYRIVFLCFIIIMIIVIIVVIAVFFYFFCGVLLCFVVPFFCTCLLSAWHKSFPCLLVPLPTCLSLACTAQNDVHTRADWVAYLSTYLPVYLPTHHHGAVCLYDFWVSFFYRVIISFPVYSLAELSARKPPLPVNLLRLNSTIHETCGMLTRAWL